MLIPEACLDSSACRNWLALLERAGWHMHRCLLVRAFLLYPDRDDRLVVAFLALAFDVDARLADYVDRAVDRVVEYPDVLEDYAAWGFGSFRLGFL